MYVAMRQTATPPPGEDHSTQGRYSSSAGARGVAADVAGAAGAAGLRPTATGAEDGAYDARVLDELKTP